MPAIFKCIGIANNEINIEIKPGMERMAELNSNFLLNTFLNFS